MQEFLRPGRTFGIVHRCDAKQMHSMEEIMKAITLRNLPPELAKAVRKEANRQRTSINRAVISLLQRKTEPRKSRRRARKYNDLDSLAGSWSKNEAAAFDTALAVQRNLDPELWK